MGLSTTLRVGLGYDSHRFDPDRRLVLGGVHVPDHAGLAGHSDGDAVAHALIDALLGAVAAGDVGSHFPPSDERWRDADSMALLGRSVEILENAGAQPVNVDVTVVCETPKIAPHVQSMRESLASVLRIDASRVSIKGKTNEEMGWIGAGEGLAVHAVALVERRGEGEPL